MHSGEMDDSEEAKGEDEETKTGRAEQADETGEEDKDASESSDGPEDDEDPDKKDAADDDTSRRQSVLQYHFSVQFLLSNSSHLSLDTSMH